MSSQKRICQECGSRRFHKDAATGRVVCQSGHVLQGYVRETQEQDEAPSQHFNVTRKVRKNKKKKVKTASQRYHGDRARFLQYEAGQILLRQQIAALIELWNLPTELELVARDLWALYVSCSDVPPAPLQHLDVLPDPPDPESLPPPLTETESDYSSDDDNLEAHMEKVKLDDQVDRPPEKPKLIRARDIKRTFHLSFTLIICYLSCATMRIPIFYADLIRLVEIGELPYLDFADRLPQSMKNFTYQSTFASLNHGLPPAIFQGSDEAYSLTSWTNRFVGLYRTMDVTFPDLNVGPLLWRACKAFCLPPTFYQSARKLLSRLDADFSFKLKSDPYNHLRAAVPTSVWRAKMKVETEIPQSYMAPDAVIVCSVILCAKSVWGLDDEQRYSSKGDALASLPKQKDWLATVQTVYKDCSNQPLKRLFSKSTTEYTEEEIDAYLDHVEDLLDNPRKRPKFFDRIEDAFPLPPKSGVHLSSQDPAPVTANLYHSVNQDTHARPEDEAVLLSGEKIKRYEKNDYGVLPRAMEQVLDIAGDLVGMRPNDLLKCLTHLEKRLSEEGMEEGWESAWQEDDSVLADLTAEAEDATVDISGLLGDKYVKDVEMEG